MTISAIDRAGDGDRLGRTLELYRDLTVALRDRITQVKTGIADCRDVERSVTDHRRALLSVLEIEASLVKRTRAWAEGASELDLDAARAEIARRLAVRTAER